MQYVLSLDVGEDNPALFGPFSQRHAERLGQELNKRWSAQYEVWPLYSSYGEYLRETGEIDD